MSNKIMNIALTIGVVLCCAITILFSLKIRKMKEASEYLQNWHRKASLQEKVRSRFTGKRIELVEGFRKYSENSYFTRKNIGTSYALFFFGGKADCKACYGEFVTIMEATPQNRLYRAVFVYKTSDEQLESVKERYFSDMDLFYTQDEAFISDVMSIPGPYVLLIDTATMGVISMGIGDSEETENIYSFVKMLAE